MQARRRASRDGAMIGGNDMSVVTETCERILEAYTTGRPIAPVRDRIRSVADAYAVQQASVEVWLARGRAVVGHKIGLTSKAVQEQLGVDEPDFGILFADMILGDGAVVEAGRVLQPRVEGELAFVLKGDLRGEQLSADDVVQATDYVCPALEICGSRIAGWDIRITDTISDNASAGMVVLGERRIKPSLDQLADISMTMRHNGSIAAEGRGSACLGNPAVAVAWLAQMLTRLGGGLRAGDVVMSGALAKMVAAEPGSSFVADFGSLGTVGVQFGK
jgi:2-keto-4-pentenoate hydratase